MKQSYEIIYELLKSFEHQSYIGESISQLQHALQSAHFAAQSGADEESVLAALLHDIGQFCSPETLQMPNNLGSENHEHIGAQFILRHGGSKKIAELVAGHVIAKRYLVSKRPSYLDSLSEASKETFALQGGFMTEMEMDSFEKDPLFERKLRIRAWDDQAKKLNFQVPELETYLPLLKKYFSSIPEFYQSNLDSDNLN